MLNIEKVIQLSVTWHTGIAVLMFPVYSYFEKKTEACFGVGEKFHGGFDNIKRAIVESLSKKLHPIFEKQPIQVQIGESYSEKEVNPVDGEAYRQAISQFIGTRIEDIACYLVVKQYCERHLEWVERVLHGAFFLFIVSVSFLVLALLQKSEIISLGVGWFIVGMTLSGMLGVALFICEYFRQHQRKRAQRVVAKYEII